jgi:hypothetical protein
VWRRRLLAWEEESVAECVALLSNIVLQENTIDRWRWVLDPINGYTVRGTYQCLTSSDFPMVRGCSDMFRLKQVPLKVSVFVWRLLRNRLPTKDNLLRRRVLQQNAIACVGGCGLPETVVHFFFRCDIFGSLWHLIYRWVGISFISPELVVDHLYYFGTLVGLSRFTYSYFQVIWHATVWVLWKERNNMIFKNTAQDLHKLLDTAMFMSFLWLKVKLLTSAFSYNDW